MTTEWNKAVITALKLGRKTNKKYSLTDAMFAAKKFYKKGTKTVMNLGRQTRRRVSNKKGYTRRSKGGALPELSPADVNVTK